MQRKADDDKKPMFFHSMEENLLPVRGDGRESASRPQRAVQRASPHACEGRQVDTCVERRPEVADIADNGVHREFDQGYLSASSVETTLFRNAGRRSWPAIANSQDARGASGSRAMACRAEAFDRLPLPGADQATRQNPHRGIRRYSHPAAQVSMRHGTTKILVAEDEPDIRSCYFMLGLRLEVVAAANGEDAVLTAARELPDLVLLDVRMPRMTGYEACRLMRANPDLRNVPVVFLSAKGQDTEIRSGMDAGAEEYLLKPFSPMDLTNRVRAILARHGK
jgi:CheY-like chemotaxis protein